MWSRNVRLYLAGLLASDLGNSALSLAAGVWVKELTGSNAAAAVVLVCLYAPSLLSPVAGLLADRYDRRRFLLVVNLGAGAGVLALLGVHGRGQVWVIDAVMVAYGATLVLIDPAETALFTEMVPAAERGGLNGVRLTIQEGTKLLAPLAGAGLFVALGGGAVAVMDAATFLVAAGTVAALRLPPRAAVPPPPTERWRTEVAAGWRQLRREPELGRVVTAAGLAMAVSGLAVGAQFALVDAVHEPPAFLGVLVSLLGAGSIAAGLLSGPVLRRTDERRLTVYGLLAGTAAYCLSVTATLPLVLVGRVVAGFALPWVVVAAITAGQRYSPAGLQGRVAAAVTLVLFASQPLAQTIGAVIIDHVDFRVIYGLTAAVNLVAAAVLATRPREAVAAGAAQESTAIPSGSVTEIPAP